MKLQDIIDRMEKEFEEMKQMLGMRRLPSYDIIERENELEVIIDLPGFSKRDVELEIGEDYVKVKASREKKKEGKYVVSERSYSFYRVISLPYNVDVNNAKAKMKNGVLEIILPIKRKAGRKIKIE